MCWASARPEIDAINGKIVEQGQALGIPTPVNALLTSLMRAIQKNYTGRGRARSPRRNCSGSCGYNVPNSLITCHSSRRFILRLSHHFGSTLREAPANVEAISHQLLVRAGFIRQLGQGLFSYLPLAKRSLTKIENILRDEMNAIGGQEMTMPVAHPAEVWQATGRWYSIGPEMARFKDRKERDMVLAMTHEEVVTDLCKTEIRSYRQLPQLVYHIQTKFRDDPRPRAGLIRVREFTMKDSYSLDADEAGLDKQYRAHYQAYFNIFNRCDLPAIAVGSDVGMMGGSLAHEYMYLTPIGEDTLVLCRNCGYAANRQIAKFAKSIPAPEELKPIEKVATPDCKSIEALANLLNMPKSKTAKAVFMIAVTKKKAARAKSLSLPWCAAIWK